MSYILEALKRAERERAQGQPAATGDGAGAPPDAPAGRALLIKVLIAVLVVNAIVFAAILLRPSPAPPAAPAERSAQALPAAKASPYAPEPLSKPAPPTIAPPASDEAVVEQGVASMDDLGASGEMDDADVEPAPKAAAATPRGRVTFAPKPLTQERAPAIAHEDDESEEPEPLPEEESDVATQPAAMPAARAPGPVASPSNPAGYKPLGEMTAAYQASFPHSRMEVHVHDAQPQRRFVLIEGKRYREGDALPQGARLLQIVPEGIVVDFRNEKVLFPIGRH